MHGMDVAIDKDLRRGIGAGRLLIGLGRLHAEMSADCAFVYGYPQPQLLRTLVGQVGFEVLGDVMMLVREPRTGDGEAGLEVTQAQLDPIAVDALWSRCRPTIGTTIVRDFEHWRQRFLVHPTVRYTILSVKDGSQRLRGLAAIRTGGIHPEALSVTDWLVEDDDQAAASALLQAIDEEALRRGLSAVVAWLRPCARAWLELQRRHGFHVMGSPYQIAFKSLATRMSRVPLAQRWHQTMSDMDFF